MKYSVLFAICINIIAILLFTGLYFINLKEEVSPKQKALWSSASGAALFLYLIFISVLFVIGLIKQNYFLISLSAFLVIPFIIGKRVRYETLRKYLLLQIFFFITSLALLVIMFIGHIYK